MPKWWTRFSQRPYNRGMADLSFTKMHGLGNDFVVVDARTRPFSLDRAGIRAIADRRTGVGCDQLIVLERPRNGQADVLMRIWNADGGEVEACGNGTRCVAALIMDESGRERAVIETAVAQLVAERADAGGVSVDMGPARFDDWRDVPLAEASDTLHVDVGAGPLRDAVAVNVGNPHAVFFVDDAESVPLTELGPALETHAMFPERANIGVVQVLDRVHVRFRVWERGVGVTRACGTGACAAVVAAARRGLTERAATVTLDGGRLHVDWTGNGHVVMTGPASLSFSGIWPG